MSFETKLISIYILIATTIINFNAVNGVDYYNEKPAYMLTCRINEPGFTNCSTKTVQKLMEQLIVIGIPEVTEAFGSFDPMHVKNIVFKQDNNEIVTLRANLTDVTVRGFSKLLVKQSRVSKKDYSWVTKFFVPLMRMDAKYKMHGRILLIPLNGAGTMFIEIDNLDIILYTKTRLYDKDGFTFDNVTGVHVDLNMTRMRAQFDNLFNGNSKEVERSTNEFFNENWRDFYEALKPVVVQTIENILFDIMHKLFNLIPANYFIEDLPTAEQFYGPKTANA